jgi:predicted amino acid-binding ACT domain protein
MATDRVGIIHDISLLISTINGDLTDIRQQVMHGYFSMIFYASFPASVSGDTIRKRLESIENDTPFEVGVKPVNPDIDREKVNPATDTFVLTARGSNRIGFVALVSGFCAEQSINVLDLSTTGTADIYTMILIVELSSCPSLHGLRSEMDTFGKKNNITLLLQHHDIFKATNEIKL